MKPFKLSACFNPSHALCLRRGQYRKEIPPSVMPCLRSHHSPSCTFDVQHIQEMGTVWMDPYRHSSRKIFIVSLSILFQRASNHSNSITQANRLRLTRDPFEVIIARGNASLNAFWRVLSCKVHASIGHPEVRPSSSAKWWRAPQGNATGPSTL
jgi:hypothetical protein